MINVVWIFNCERADNFVHFVFQDEPNFVLWRHGYATIGHIIKVYFLIVAGDRSVKDVVEGDAFIFSGQILRRILEQEEHH